MLQVFCIFFLLVCVKTGKNEYIVDKFPSCGYQTYLSWKTRVSSTIQQTPHIVDFFDDDRKEILIPTAVRFVEAIDGEDGEELEGWPFSHPHFTSTSSALLYDIDRDGEMEIILSTFDGDILFFNQEGELLTDYTIKIPPLMIDKDWYVGLDEDIEVSMNLRGRQMLTVDEGEPQMGDLLEDLESEEDLTDSNEELVEEVDDEIRTGIELEETKEELKEKLRAFMEKADSDLENLNEDSEDPVASKRREYEHKKAMNRLKMRDKRYRKTMDKRLGQDYKGNLKRHPNVLKPKSKRRPNLDEPRIRHPHEPKEEEEEEQQQDEESETEQENEKEDEVVKVEEEEKKEAEEIEDPKKVEEEQVEEDLPVLPSTSPRKRRRRRRRRRSRSHTQKSEISKRKKRVSTQDGWLSEAAKASMHLIYDPEVDDTIFELVEDDLLHPKNYRSDMELLQKEAIKKNKVLVDAHVLSTPTIVDLFGDGKEYLVISVSYFFDPEYYSHAEHMRQIPMGVDINKYIAGGLVVYDLESRQIKWSLHLDLTTKKTEHTALVYTSPTIIDFDTNGSLDILLSNSMGHLYAISRSGEVHKGFPLLMKDIQGMVLAEDLNADGNIEICVMNVEAKYVCYKSDGKVLWEHALAEHFPSEFPKQEEDKSNFEPVERTSRFSGVVGDVNGDGNLNIVLSFSNGLIFALDGATGEIVENFPLKIDGEVHAPISLIDFNEFELDDEEELTFLLGKNNLMDQLGATASAEEYVQKKEEEAERQKYRQKLEDGSMIKDSDQEEMVKLRKQTKIHGLDVILPSYNGKVYIINSRLKCADSIDVGEESMSRVLVDDLTGDGSMELLVSAINGEVTCIGTRLPYHPLKTTHGEIRMENGFTYRLHHQGIYVPTSSRKMRDVVGSHFTMDFVIHDQRKLPKMFPRKYRVQISIGKKEILLDKVYETPGRKSVTLNVPNHRMKGTVDVTMTNEHGQMFVDSFTISFNMKFLRVLKWAVLLPFFITLFFVYGLDELKELRDIKSVLPK